MENKNYEKNEERNVYELINRALYCDDLLLMAERLIEFADKALLESNKSSIVKNFFEKLVQYTMGDYIFYNGDKNYIVYEKQAAVSRFLYLSIPKKNGPVKNLKAIRDVGVSVVENFCKPIGESLNKEIVDEIMTYLNIKYDYSQKVFRDRLAIICILDYSNRSYNSECLVLKSEGMLIQNLLLYHMNGNSDVHPVAVFFHELGHCIHARYCGSLDIIPNEIIEVLEKLCMPKINYLSDCDKAEVLADVLGMGLMYGSPYEKYDCFTQIYPEHKKVFNMLVTKIFEKVK